MVSENERKLRQALEQNKGLAPDAPVTWDDFADYLRETKITQTTLEELIDADLPFPMSFMLFRPAIRFVGGSALFMRKGSGTANVVIKDSDVVFANDPDSFQTSVQVRFKAGTIVLNARTMRLEPNIVAVRYEYGAGVRFADSSLGSPPRPGLDWDLIVVPLPFRYKPHSWFSSMTGKFSNELVGGESYDDEYADVFQHVLGELGYNHEELTRAQVTSFSPEGVFKPLEIEQSICCRGPQLTYNRVHKKLHDSGVGRTALGPRADPHAFLQLKGAGAEYAGTGVQGSTFLAPVLGGGMGLTP